MKIYVVEYSLSFSDPTWNMDCAFVDEQLAVTYCNEQQKSAELQNKEHYYRYEAIELQEK